MTTTAEYQEKLVVAFSKCEYASLKALERHYRELIASEHVQKEELQKKIQTFVYDYLQKKISNLVPELGNEIKQLLNRFRVDPIQPLWVHWGFIHGCMFYITEYRLHALKEYVLRMYRYQ